MNIDAIKNLNDFSKQKVDYLDKAKKEGQNTYIKAIRNSILFVDPTKPQTSQIYSKNYVEDLLSAGINTKEEKKDRNVKELVGKFKTLSKDERFDVLKEITGYDDATVQRMVDAEVDIKDISY